ncbi:IS630 family transposase [Verminephrobacter eiseniae]|uniref:IS630 family transposase n=1 Tax=Verminephrobacter eiseniae TaxID=364317 RepID=UPI002237A70E|nr:IS630 family transposase [Verminephrobacter eiseniae]MCW5234186.1 IS630 family transposase [Verminephrobacter eiseniae]MCW5294258.1 IS630 family transposase [Verminephrobacter eiseniae]MCW8184999.1 IS630 family transposase [Verminephrobacter eiseniae]MCW8223897.1 IS630 family transposase [Verminephrobacter eiseniae]MCW8235168.1 IS630 family transposase [Verminephrobacter eiseniae]
MEKYIVTLDAEERQQLEGLISKGTHAVAKVRNALILLNCDTSQGLTGRRSSEEIAAVLHISARKVDRIKQRFVTEGFEAALERKATSRGYESKMDGDLEAHLVAMSCSQPPQGRTCWTLRLLADKAVELNYVEAISYETVRRALKKRTLKPWKKVGWVIAPEANAGFVAAMENVLDIYKRPYDPARPVVCMDETPRQLIGQVREPIAASSGRVMREDYEYQRLGVCNVFMACEPLAGRRITKVTAQKTKVDWAQFLDDIAQQYQQAQRITLVMDNLNTHTPASLYETFEPQRAKAQWDRFEFVYTPKHRSWLNMAEIELNVMIGQCLNRRIASIETLRQEVAAWQAQRGQFKATINWQFTSDSARIKLKRLYPTFDL